MNHKANKDIKSLRAFRQCFTVYLDRVSNSGQTDHIKGFSMKFLDKVNNWIEHRGELETIRRVKFIRHQIYLALAESEPLYGTRYPIYRDGMPKDLGPWAATLVRMRDIPAIRDILTLLQVSYVIQKWGPPNYDGIEEPSTSDSALEIQIAAYVKDFPIKMDVPDIYWNEPHSTAKMGPNGPAMVTSHDDLMAISDQRKADLITFAGYRYGIYLENCLGARDYLVGIRRELFPIKGDRSDVEIIDSRISIVESPEGKSRIIAIFDYWSQSALKPLHDWAFAQLRKFKTDCTFNQGGFDKSGNGAGYFASFDLKGATDRFPASLQRRILANFIGEEKASAWCRIMTDRDFQKHDRSGTVRYRAGQPMGAYSSWAIFTLCHHYVINYAAATTGHSGVFSGYNILGDDIVIYDQKVAQAYKSVIQRLGVEIQEEKSLVSCDTFEFAKRIFHKGQELTGFPLAAIVANHRSVSALWSVTLICRERGYGRLNPFAIPGFVESIQRSCGVTLRSTKHIAKYYEAIRGLISHGADDSLLEWSLNAIHKTMHRDNPCRSNLILKKQSLIWDLGYFIMAYKASLVDTAYQRFNQLSFQITGQDWEAGGIEGMGSHATAPIDMMRIPIVWVARLAAERQRQEISVLMDHARNERFEVFLSLPVSPIGDLTRLMSHNINKHALSRHDGMMKTIRFRQKHLNQLLEEAYQAPQE
jgi:hypothetical protein